MAQPSKPIQPPKVCRRRFSRREEWANSAIHALGALLGLIGIVLLVSAAEAHGRAGSLVAVVVYGLTLVFLFLSSALYHGLRRDPAKRLFLSLDHAGIILVIAGTYTAFCLVLDPPQQRLLLALIWSLALVGLALEIQAFRAGQVRRYEKRAYLGYLVMGWAPILVSGPAVFAALASAGAALLVAGGIAYSLGVFFYLRTQLRFGHAIWHLFVLSASALHFFAVLFYVVPQPL